MKSGNAELSHLNTQHTHTAKMCWNVNVYSPLCPAPGKKWTCWEIVCWSLYGLFLCLTFVIGTCARITVLIYHSVLCAVKQTIAFVGLCSSIMSLTSALRVLLIFLTIVKMFFVRNVGLLLTCWLFVGQYKRRMSLIVFLILYFSGVHTEDDGILCIPNSQNKSINVMVT